MKKYLFFIAVLLIAKISSGQYCGNAGPFECSVDGSLTHFGVSDYATFPCVHDSVPYHEVLQIFFPDSADISIYRVQVLSFSIDSVTNLPCGLCWSCNDSTFTYAGGTKGCLLISGTTNDLHGAYQINVYGKANTSFGTANGTLASLGYPFFLNVVGQYDDCTPINFSTSNISCSTGPPPTPPTCNFATQVVASSSASNCHFDSTTLTVIEPTGPSYQYSWTLFSVSYLFNNDVYNASGPSVGVNDSLNMAWLTISDSTCYESFSIYIDPKVGPVCSPTGICYATADSSLPDHSGLSFIFEKNDWFNNITGFQIYRQDSANQIYLPLIGQIGAGSPGIITDENPLSFFSIHPALGFNGLMDLYALSYTTACDNPSDGLNLWSFFTPSTLGVDTLQNGLPRLIWNNSDPLTYNKIYIYSRYPGGSWRLRYGSINLNDTLWIDQQPDSTNMQYMLAYDLTVDCDPFRSANHTAFSNFGTTVVSAEHVYHDTTTTNTGINQISASATVLLYPNPANDKLHLQIADVSTITQLNYKIYNMLGQLISASSLPVDSRNELNVESLASGVYTITLQANNQPLAIKKFVKK